jgi:hypothetical protein
MTRTMELVTGVTAKEALFLLTVLVPRMPFPASGHKPREVSPYSTHRLRLPERKSIVRRQA